MHFGAVVREVLSASCGADLRDASAGTEVPELRSPDTQRVLADALARAFGVTIPAPDLDRLMTVRDVLQCVRLHRWVARVEGAPSATAAEPIAPAAVAAEALAGAGLRIRRRPSGETLPSAEPPAPIRREGRR
ncbi:MAG TPA: hypothetical protein VGK30_15485 [Candidatus Binatia bacterium]|jgi:hypothetical protein